MAQPTAQQLPTLELQVSKNTSDLGKANTRPFWKSNAFRPARFSVPSSRRFSSNALHSRRLSDSRLSSFTRDVEVIQQNLEHLRQLHSAREQLLSEKSEGIAKKRPSTWLNTLDEVNHLIETVIEVNANANFEASDVEATRTEPEISRSRSARRYVADVSLHDDVDYRISRHLREPITVAEEVKSPNGLPVRIEAALDACKRGEFSTGQPEEEHLPLRLRSVSSPVRKSKHHDHSQLDGDSDKESLLNHAAKINGSKQHSNGDQQGSFLTLRRKSTSHHTYPHDARPILGGSSVLQSGYEDQSHIHPAFRSPSTPPPPSLPASPPPRFSFPDTSSDDDADADDVPPVPSLPSGLPTTPFATTTASRPVRTVTSTQRLLNMFPDTPSPTSSTYNSWAYDSSINSRSPRPLILQNVRRRLSPPTPTSPTAARPPRPPTPIPRMSTPTKPKYSLYPAQHSPLSPPPTRPTTPSTPPPHTRPTTPKTPHHQPLPSSPPSTTTSRPSSTFTTQELQTATHQSLLLDALLGVSKGQPTHLGAHEAAILPEIIERNRRQERRRECRREEVEKLKSRFSAMTEEEECDELGRRGAEWGARRARNMAKRWGRRGWVWGRGAGVGG